MVLIQYLTQLTQCYDNLLSFIDLGYHRTYGTAFLYKNYFYTVCNHRIEVQYNFMVNDSMSIFFNSNGIHSTYTK
jgi:hypothetical protein